MTKWQLVVVYGVGSQSDGKGNTIGTTLSLWPAGMFADLRNWAAKHFPSAECYISATDCDVVLFRFPGTGLFGKMKDSREPESVVLELTHSARSQLVRYLCSEGWEPFDNSHGLAFRRQIEG